MSRKQPDLFGAFGCSDCHDVVDGRKRALLDWPARGEIPSVEIRLFFYDGVIRTQQYWLDNGFIVVK